MHVLSITTTLLQTENNYSGQLEAGSRALSRTVAHKMSVRFLDGYVRGVYLKVTIRTSGTRIMNIYFTRLCAQLVEQVDIHVSEKTITTI